MSFSQGLREAMKKKGVTAYRLSKDIGIHQTTISNWLNGKSTPKAELLEKIASALGVSAAFLMGWENSIGETDVNLAVLEIAKKCGVRWENVEDVMEGRPTHDNLKPEIVQAIRSELQTAGLITQVQAIPCHIACGNQLAAENIEGCVDVPEDVHIDFALICRGDSMINAGIQNGDVVYIREQHTVESGQIAAVRIGEEVTLKRVYFDGDTIILQSANINYAPLSFHGDELNEITIEGVAVGYTHWF